MAMTPDLTYSAYVQLMDRDQNRSGVTFQFPAANTIGNVEGELTDVIIPALNLLSDASVVGYNITYGSYDFVAPQAPETSDVERKGVFTFRADNGQIVKYEIPSVRNTLVVDGTNVLNPADAAVTGFINAVLTAGLDGLAPTTNIGATLVSTSEPAHKIHRKSRRG